MSRSASASASHSASASAGDDGGERSMDLDEDDKLAVKQESITTNTTISAPPNRHNNHNALESSSKRRAKRARNVNYVEYNEDEDDDDNDDNSNDEYEYKQANRKKKSKLVSREVVRSRPASSVDHVDDSASDSFPADDDQNDNVDSSEGDVRSSSASVRPPRMAGDKSKYAESGIIKSIFLKNFLTHRVITMLPTFIIIHHH